jgi:hypothetical protein
MRKLIVTALVAIGALGATGCLRINVTMGNEIAQDHVEMIVPGQTTKADILRWFGAPAEYTDGEIFARLTDVGEIAAEDLVALPYSDILVYEIIDARVRGVVTFILLNWVNAHVLRDRLVVFFDQNDVVLYYGITRQREDRHETAQHHEEEQAAHGEAESR